ncbi:Predicted metal-binding protein [Desulfatibacillum alkenivorans DSM 16219]|uniref:Predicted metal-binding protein n=1 Tax=Desulfatibacillum alkenivorans DSM 16219 TaxID=1121393 RepID=A0A1M6SH48_9BACT|nr:CGGC domain-containing protein [Desulfatibacillum alkenivorans]SHK43828.1 Predicted metal-binding protein [Desulfatibacillum alkenivorans DSM 16219]
MEKIGIIRCEKNETTCPLVGCIKPMSGKAQAYKDYEDPQLMGVFTCRCPGDNVVELAGIMKKKGIEFIHFPTCLFSTKTEDGWASEPGGFCGKLPELMKAVHEATGLPVVAGTGHLPKGHIVEVIK